MNMNIILVGAGGIGCWLAMGLNKFLMSNKVTSCRLAVFDGDNVEEKNLDRQFHHEADIGSNKAEALCENLFNVEIADTASVQPNYFMEGQQVQPLSLIFCCADNHAARKAVLGAVDQGDDCKAIICGNETTDAEAYVYFPHWRGKLWDPRVMYPEILTDNSGNPVHPEGCTGEIQLEKPQLAIANMAAAACGLYLFHTWFIDRPTFPGNEKVLPIIHKVGKYGFKTLNAKEIMAEKEVAA